MAKNKSSGTTVKRKGGRKELIIGIITTLVVVGVYLMWQFVLYPKVGTSYHPLDFYVVNDGSKKVVAVYYKTLHHSGYEDNNGMRTDSWSEVRGYSVRLY